MSLWGLRYCVGRNSLAPDIEDDHQVRIGNGQILREIGAAAPVADR